MEQSFKYVYLIGSKQADQEFKAPMLQSMVVEFNET
jgi:hypothetical protein